MGEGAVLDGRVRESLRKEQELQHLGETSEGAVNANALRQQ